VFLLISRTLKRAVKPDSLCAGGFGAAPGHTFSALSRFEKTQATAPRVKAPRIGPSEYLEVSPFKEIVSLVRAMNKGTA
jgi:hypothetical protein